MAKKWLVLNVIAILALVILSALLLLYSPPKGDVVKIYKDNKLFKTCPLDIDNTFTITNNGYSNTIQIKDSMVSIIATTCEGKDCQKMGAISGKGQALICLKSNIKIIIISENSDVDTEI